MFLFVELVVEVVSCTLLGMSQVGGEIVDAVVITHKYRGSQQFSRVEYSTQIYKFHTRGAKEYLKILAAKLSIQPHLEINYLQQSD